MQVISVAVCFLSFTGRHASKVLPMGVVVTIATMLLVPLSLPPMVYYLAELQIKADIWQVSLRLAGFPGVDSPGIQPIYNFDCTLLAAWFIYGDGDWACMRQL